MPAKRALDEVALVEVDLVMLLKILAPVQVFEVVKSKPKVSPVRVIGEETARLVLEEMSTEVRKPASLVKSAKVTAVRSSSDSATVSASSEQVVPLQVKSPKSEEASIAAVTSLTLKVVPTTSKASPAMLVM